MNNSMGDVSDDVWVSKKINMQISFEPKKIFIKVFQNLSSQNIIVDTSIHNSKTNYAEGQNIRIYANEITQNSFILNVWSSYRWVDFTVKEIIAIG